MTNGIAAKLPGKLVEGTNDRWRGGALTTRKSWGRLFVCSFVSGPSGLRGANRQLRQSLRRIAKEALEAPSRATASPVGTFDDVRRTTY